MLFSHINDLIYPEKNIKEVKFNKHIETLQQIISDSFSGEDKKIIVFTAVEPWEKFIYNKNKKFDNFDFIEIKLKHKQKFIVDDHPNVIGHKYIADTIYNFINS